MNFPDDWEGSSTTAAVAELVAGIVLPPIEPLATDMAAVASLPRLPSLERGPDGIGTAPSQLAVVQAFMDECVGIVAAFNALANRTAASLAAVFEGFATAAAIERSLLGISEAAANGLVDYSTVMVRELLSQSLQFLISNQEPQSTVN